MEASKSEVPTVDHALQARSSELRRLERNSLEAPSVAHSSWAMSPEMRDYLSRKKWIAKSNNQNKDEMLNFMTYARCFDHI